MKIQVYSAILMILFLFACGSEDDSSASNGSVPDPGKVHPVGESPYEIPESLKDYYHGVDFALEGEELLEELASLLIGSHSHFLDYGQRHTYLYQADEDPANSNNVLLVYSGESRNKQEYVSGNNPHEPQTFNTEHIFPQSKIGNTAKGDLHHLKPADAKINNSRSNHPYTDAEGDYQLIGGNSFYPGDEWKGDVARMILYMNLRYDEDFEEVGSLELFLEWNTEDPVSAIEKNRNDIIQGAQGNRNPFIDNPHLASRIWGGKEAQNRWDGKEEPEEKDEEPPSIPLNLSAEASFESVLLSWEASTDNERVMRYEVSMNGEAYGSISSLSLEISGLDPGSKYFFAVLAVDASGNRSETSEAIEVNTLIDTETPSVPEGLQLTTTSATAIALRWEASTDNAGIAEYEVSLNGELYATVTDTAIMLTDLEASTNYSIHILARDIYGNESAASAVLDVTTEAAGDEDEEEAAPGSASDLFFSEYIEGSSFNKALEIVNFTGTEVDLSSYSIRKQVNGLGEWKNTLALEGTLAPGDVLVAAHSSASEEILAVAAIIKGSGPLDFNGDDPVGLFKDGELIDLIGIEGDIDFAKDMSLRRKTSGIRPSSVYNEGDWEIFQKDSFEGLGRY